MRRTVVSFWIRWSGRPRANAMRTARALAQATFLWRRRPRRRGSIDDGDPPATLTRSACGRGIVADTVSKVIHKRRRKASAKSLA